MSERGMIFNGESVRAFLAGRKSMTRRVANKRLWPFFVESARVNGKVYLEMLDWEIPCPYKVGDLIYGKETWATIKLHNNKAAFAIDRYTNPPLWYRADDPPPYETSCNPWPEGNMGKWRSPLSMPKWAARIWLEISGIRVERLQEQYYFYADEVLGPGIVTARKITAPWVWVIELKEKP